MEVVSVVYWSQARKKGRSIGLQLAHTGAGQQSLILRPLRRHNVIMQDACLLRSLTGSQLKISLLRGFTPRISTRSTGVDNSSLAISQRIRTSNNEYSNHGWTLR